MPLIQLIYISSHGSSIRTPEGIAKAYEPFWATPDYVVRFKRARRRLFTIEEYGERILGSTLEALRQEAQTRKLSDKGTREQLIERLVIKPIAAPDDPWAVASTMELRLECIARGLPSEGGRAQLFERLSIEDGVHPGPLGADGDGPGADEGLDLEDDLEGEPDADIEDAPTSTTMTTEQRAALLQALDADDYGAIYAATKAITGQAPPKAKAELIAAAQSLLK